MYILVHQRSAELTKKEWDIAPRSFSFPQLR